MDSREFQLLREAIRRHTGIVYGSDTAYLLERRLQPRLSALSLRRFADYHDYLQQAQPAERERELLELCEHIVTHETYFFRENHQLAAFREEILPQLHRAAPRGPYLSVWSAGCSTGEEAYTLAIEVLETGLFRDWTVEILGTDLTQGALRTAQAGRYGASSFRQVDDEEERLCQRYFHDRDGKRQVTEEVRRLVQFRRHNLMGPDYAAIVGSFDAIFCRNVLIYLDRGLRPGLIERFRRKLYPGGYLLLGHSESLLDTQTAFEVVHLRREMVYRKPSA